jgi:uncharacterized RDD family membrane protein YckC
MILPLVQPVRGSTKSCLSGDGMSDASRQIDAMVEVVTPENIAVQYRVAGPCRRFAAYLIDLAFRTLIVIGIATVASTLSLFIGSVSDFFVLLVMFVVGWFYGGLFETYWNGQTPGKRLMGIRVLTTKGQPIAGWQAVLRNIVRVVDMGPMVTGEIFGLPPIPILPTFFIGLAIMVCNRRSQRFGDLACGTMVVIDEPPWMTGVAEIEDPRAFQLASYLPADMQVSRTMARALAHYAERRRFFSAPRRREVARHLAEPLLKQFGLPADTSYDLFLCSMYYRVFIADRMDDERHAARAEAALGQDSAGDGIQFLSEDSSEHIQTTT